MGQEVYYAKEDTDCCTRQCCGPARPFDINIVDTQVMGTSILTSVCGNIDLYHTRARR